MDHVDIMLGRLIIESEPDYTIFQQKQVLQNDGAAQFMKQQNYEIKKQLDATGLTCPEPVMLLHKIMREVVAGECIEVLATDPSTQRDIPKFCQFLNHELLWQAEVDQQFIYHLRKGK